jgi:flagellar biosynthesis protein FliQ
MNPDSALDLVRDTLSTTLVMVAPLLAVALIVGLVLGFLQSLTQIHDASIAIIPKLIVLAVCLLLLLPWLTDRIVDHTRTMYENIPHQLAGR